MAMRRTDHYTVPDKLYSIPEPKVYRDAYFELPFLRRLFILLRSWFSKSDISRMIKEQELETIKHRIADDESAILDPTIPALRDGFHSRIRTVGQLIQKLKPVLMEVRGSGAGPFLRGMLEKLDSELYKTLQAACVIPEEILTKATTTVAGAKKRVQHDLLQALEINEKTIKEYLTPIWNSIEALALLSTVDFAALVPGEGGKGLQVPMRPVKDQLIQLACAMDVCSRNNRPGAIKGATEYVSLRTGKRNTAGETIWQAIDDVLKAIPLADLARLAADEPRMELVQITTPNNWWQRFSATWLERIDVQGPLMRHRSMVLEEILRSGFEVGEPVPAWIPPSLYQRSAGAFRRLATAQRFRDTRTMVGALAREHSAMPAADRAKILEAHVELDRVYTRLEELIGIGESRGMLGDDLRRLRQADEARASVAGMQKMNIYTKHRPTMRTLIDQGIEAMNTIAGHYSRNKTLLKKMLRSGVLRIDLGSDEVTPTEILELVTDGYIKLAQALRSLVALEHELTKGLQSAADEEEEETTAVDEAG